MVLSKKMNEVVNVNLSLRTQLHKTRARRLQHKTGDAVRREKRRE